MVLRIALPNLLTVMECHSCTSSVMHYLLYPFHASDAPRTCLNPKPPKIQMKALYYKM